MDYVIYSIKKGKTGQKQSGSLIAEGFVYGEKSAKGALDAFTYNKIGGTYYQNKTLVAFPKSAFNGAEKWSELTKRYREGKNIRLRRQKKRR